MQGDFMIADTSKEAFRKYFEVLRGLGMEGRARMAFELSNTMRAAVEAGVRQRHSEYDEEQVRWAVLRLMIGQKLFQQAFPTIKVRG